MYYNQINKFYFFGTRQLASLGLGNTGQYKDTGKVVSIAYEIIVYSNN